MKIAVKKYYIIGLLGFVFFLTGYIIFNMFIEVLTNNGLYGLISLCLFLCSLIWLIIYFQDYSWKVKLAKEAAKEVVSMELKTNPSLFQHTTMETVKNQIEAHLISKIDEEKYVLWGKKTK